MSASCTTCINTGPVLMPLRYAIVPDFVSQELPGWAAPATAFPALNGYHYALRCVRQGFIYVYYDTGAGDLLDWEVWNIDESGDLYWSSNVLSAHAVFNPLPCGRPIHRQANLEHMALNENALSNETWVAFSHAPWTKETIERYTRDPAERKLRMQNIQPGDWTAVGATFGDGLCRADESMLDSVLDYRPNLSGSPKYPLCDSDDPLYRVSYIEAGQYHFYADKVRPHTTFHPWVRNRKVQGAAARTMKAMQSRSLGPGGKAVNPLMIALKDPAGIAHELTSWCDGLALAHQTYLEELNVEFWTWRNINGVRSQVEQMTTLLQTQREQIKGDRELKLMQAMTAGKHSEAAVQQVYQSGVEQLNRDELAYDWKKYSDKLDHERLNQFTETYDSLCKLLDEMMRQLVDLRLLWLQDAHFLQCLDDHKTDNVEDNLNYREIVGYAISGINMVPAGRAIIKAWIEEYSSDKRSNLFWRRQFFNNPEVMVQIAPVLVEMKQDATKPDRPATEAETFFILAAISRLSVFMAKYNDSCDRAIEALDRYSKKATLSITRKFFVRMDSALLTFTTQIFNKSILGRRVDSLNYFVYKSIFYRDAGIASEEFSERLKKRLNPSDFSKWKQQSFVTRVQSNAHDKTLNTYIKTLSERSELRLVQTSRVKLLGTILSVWDFTNQSYELFNEGKGSASDIMAAGLFAASFGINTALPAMESMVEASKKISPFTEERTIKSTSTWKIRANYAGSFAAGLTVLSDFGQLFDSFKKDGTAFWKGVGISGVKILSDSAYTIVSAEELLKLLGKRGLISILMPIAESAEGITIRTLLAGALLESIAVLASWQIMIALAIAPQIIALYLNNELQDWFEESLFGKELTTIDYTKLSRSDREKMIDTHMEKLSRALHEVIGLPLSDEINKKDQERKLIESKQQLDMMRKLKY